MTEEANSMAAIWEHIDKHREQITKINEHNSGLSERMVALETRFSESNKTQTEGHARIETKLDTLAESVGMLNKEKTKKEGYEEAKTEHFRLLRWIIGGIIAAIGSGALSIQFMSDKL